MRIGFPQFGERCSFPLSLSLPSLPSLVDLCTGLIVAVLVRTFSPSLSFHFSRALFNADANWSFPRLSSTSKVSPMLVSLFLLAFFAFFGGDVVVVVVLVVVVVVRRLSSLRRFASADTSPSRGNGIFVFLYGERILEMNFQLFCSFLDSFFRYIFVSSSVSKIHARATL